MKSLMIVVAAIYGLNFFCALCAVELKWIEDKIWGASTLPKVIWGKFFMRVACPLAWIPWVRVKILFVLSVLKKDIEYNGGHMMFLFFLALVGSLCSLAAILIVIQKLAGASPHSSVMAIVTASCFSLVGVPALVAGLRGLKREIKGDSREL